MKTSKIKLKEDFGIWWDMPKYKKKDIPSKQYSDRYIVDIHSLNSGWPGPEEDVNYWVELDNNIAVGFHEPQSGKAEFPFYNL
jgi:hypothetical protein